MNSDLHDLWQSDSAGNPELLRRLQLTTSGFDRTIRFRDLRESVAGGLVCVIFLWLAWKDPTPLESAAHLWLAACGIWIIAYIRRYARASQKPAPEQTLVSYQQQLLQRYDRQIGLLRSAKYWYILPFWMGLMFSAAAFLIRTGDWTRFSFLAVWVTLINATLWWLNEGFGVRYLQGRRTALAELTGA